MRLGDKRREMAFALRHPKTTVRWRLTMLYGGLFLISGAGLLAITYTLVAHATVTQRAAQAFQAEVPAGPPGQVRGNSPIRGFARIHSSALLNRIRRLLGSKPGQIAVGIVGSDQRIADLHQLEVESVIALAIMAAISGALGWLVAGRVLGPLRTMTATTRQISEVNLNRRLAMGGRRDELRELADTIDGLLERLEGAFNAQRRFVANASHELRTPLSAARALLEMVLTDPHATLVTFRDTCEQVLDEGEHQEQLIDALLALAHGQRGIDHPEPIDVAAVVGNVLDAHEPAAAARGLRVDAALEPALISGDRRLIERLASNLLDNAIRHNRPDGHVRVVVKTQAGNPTLTLANNGAPVPADEIGRLLQPFQRLAPDRVGHRDGLGLGLSIVAAITSAHDATLDVAPGIDGGLEIEVRFPPATPRVALRPEPSRSDSGPLGSSL
jgi:signal transduction histidine kinase